MSATDSIITIFKYFFLVIFTLLLIGQLTAFTLAHATQAVLLDAKFYKSELDSAGVYDYVYASFSQRIKDQGGAQAEALIGLSGISMQDVITKAWIKSQAESLIDNGLAYLNGQHATAELYIDLTDPKARLMAAAEAKVSQLQGQGGNSSAMLAQLKAQLDQQVPDRVDLAAQAGAAQGLEQGRSAVQTAKTATLALAVLALVFAGLIALLARKSMNSIARWLGTALLVAGLLSLFLVGVAQEQAEKQVAAYSHTQEGQVFLKIAQDGGQAVQQAAFPLAAAFIVLGALALVASFVLPKPQTTADVKPAEFHKAPEKKKN